MLRLMHPDERRLFDKLFDQVVAELPGEVRRLFHEVPVVVEDHPSADVMAEFGAQHIDELCGLHSGVPLTERSVAEGQAAPLPDAIYIFREGIVTLSLDDEGYIDNAELTRQMRITLLHEVGHHFGMTEADLAELGYD